MKKFILIAVMLAISFVSFPLASRANADNEIRAVNSVVSVEPANVETKVFGFEIFPTQKKYRTIRLFENKSEVKTKSVLSGVDKSDFG